MGFLQNMDSQLIIWAAIGILAVFGIMVINNKMRRVAAFGARAAAGVVSIAAINFVLGGFGAAAAVGINVLTMGVVAFLGIPGVVMLYGLAFIL
ncbi:MAG: pro-sigmaK processing inhibitor BofA family protein [Clostridiales bacterium]|jgi:inhibitor of the pro-sigma K processing machinery|nr:pro-sigmaK processing inhibitor BofA family protein [Clostridiales bacterium]